MTFEDNPDLNEEKQLDLLINPPKHKQLLEPGKTTRNNHSNKPRRC